MSHITVFPTRFSLPARMSMAELIPGAHAMQKVGVEVKQWGHRLYKGSLFQDFTTVLAAEN